MWKSSLVLDIYLYAKTNPYLVKTLAILGIISTILMALGFLNFINLNPLYLIIFGPIIAIFIINKLMRFTLQLFYQGLNIEKHKYFISKFWAENKEPTVNIFLPWAGEDIKMHEEVVRAATQLNYKNYKVYMLDDIGSSEHKKLAEKYNANYLSRPNKGVYKKSGNLEFGYRNSNGEFVLILDADFIPIKDILKHLIPYIASDKKIGIIQTPQYFEQTNNIHNKSKIEFGGGNIVEEFYRIVMPCRDEFKAAMCVGTSAIYRRHTISLLNGTPKVHASEDLATGLLITQYRYYVKYLPLIVSMGKSPETYQGYFKQHMRWCSGNLVFAKYWPIARLSLMGRLIYATNPLHYFSEALSIIFSFQLLFLLYFHSESLSLMHTLYFLPYIILSRFLLPLTKKNKNKIGTRLAALNNSYTYFYTYIRMLVKGVPAWQPSGVKSSKLHADFNNAFNMGTIISSLYIITFIFVLIKNFSVFGNFNTYIVLAWCFYSVFWHSIYLTSVAKYIHQFKIENVGNIFTKSFVFARTYSSIFLLLVVVSISIPNAIIAISNPYSPTYLAVNNFLNIQDESQNIAMEPKEIMNPNVLGVQAEEKNSLSFSVKRGDTLIELSENAVTKYLNQYELELTNEELNYASYLIANEMADEIQLKPEDNVEFNFEIIKSAIYVAVEKFN